ncbi:MAG: hypothetical protein GXY82_07645 [Methanospirillum sp.]|nr:hypothetical protein [Methanospirillum sp.]
MKSSYLLILLVAGIAVLAAGCTGTDSGGTTTTVPTTGAPSTGAATVATTGVETGEPAVTGTAAATGTLETLPSYLALSIQVNRHPINRDIEVLFNGGPGQGSARSMEVTMIRSDGTTETRPLELSQGSTVTFRGSPGTDTVSVKASFTNGRTYRFFEQAVK